MKTKQLFISLTLGLGLVMALLWILGTGSVLAANLSVTKFTDGNDGSCTDDCSLREAIQEANDTPGPDTITLLTGTHTLTITGAYEDNNATGDLDVTEALTITGAGPDVTIIDAGGLSDRVLQVLTGPVVISGVTIRNGSGIDQGGGILNEATLTLINSTVFTNSANYGGGIANQGTVQLSNCTISGNTAYTNGGAIDNWTDCTVELTNSTISSNTAGTDGGGIFNNGGVVTLTGSIISSNTTYTSGGGIKSEIGGMVELINSTVNDNIAIRGDGGGIDNLGTARLTNSTISGNTAGHDGGGIDNWENSTVELTNSTISDNTANYGGGIANQGTVQLSNCTISSNTAYTNGGGINNWPNSTVELTNSAVSGNTASYGGGIGSQGTVRLTNCIISSNTAYTNGGGIDNWTNSTVELTNSTVSSNTASYGGGLFLDSKDAVLTNIIVADNQANTAGSGLYIEASSPRLLHTTIARNSGGDGSGVHITGTASTVAITNTILVSHTVGITVTGGNTVTINGVLWYGTPVTVSQATAATVMVQNQHEDDPAFAPDGYHLTDASKAIDKGVDAGVNYDIDGHPRPMGHCYDIGADEFGYVIYLPIILKSY